MKYVSYFLLTIGNLYVIYELSLRFNKDLFHGNITSIFLFFATLYLAFVVNIEIIIFLQLLRQIPKKITQ